MYFVYMLRCKDSSIYTGITNDINKRMEAHFSKKGAKYTKSHDPLKIEVLWKCKEKTFACSLEYHIKHLTKLEKENIIKGYPLKKYLKNKVDLRRYRKINPEEIADSRFVKEEEE